MGVRRQEADDLFTSDAHSDSVANRFTSDLPGYHVRIAGGEACEKLQNGDLELRCCIGVDTVVRFYHYKTFAVRGAKGVVKAGRGTPKGAGIGGQSGGKAGGVETGRGGSVLVNNAEIREVVQHLKLGRSEGGFAVVLTEFETAEHKEEGKDVNGVHVHLKYQQCQRYHCS